MISPLFESSSFTLYSPSYYMLSLIRKILAFTLSIYFSTDDLNYLKGSWELLSEDGSFLRLSKKRIYLFLDAFKEIMSYVNTFALLQPKHVKNHLI